MEHAQFRQTLAHMLRARIPLIHVATSEEERAYEAILQIAEDGELLQPVRKVFYADLRTITNVKSGKDLAAKLAHLLDKEKDGPSIIVLYDIHAFFSENRIDYPLIRTLKLHFQKMKHSAVPASIVFLSATAQFPPELEKDILRLDFPLPGTRELGQLLDSMIAANKDVHDIEVDLDGEGRERIVQAALGLTWNEAESAFSLAMVKDGRLSKDDVEVVLEEKRQIIKRSGMLEYIGSGVKMDEVGGLDNLKHWLAKRDNSWSAQAAEYGLSAPKGVLLTGVPGCGKSLIAKAVSTLWQLPLLRLDVGKLFGMWVGSSESNIRNAIQIAEAIAPCVLWIDEIEKGFSGVGQSGDSGTSSRVFGTFLTWMQEKSKMVFVIATANDISRLPPEMMRKGRFDEIFFVDLPTRREREQIVRTHLQKRLKQPADPDMVQQVADRTDGFSGAELEQVVVAGLFEAFSERRPLALADVLQAAENTVPLSVTQLEKLIELRSWAMVRAVPATLPDAPVADEPATTAAVENEVSSASASEGEVHNELGLPAPSNQRSPQEEDTPDAHAAVSDEAAEREGTDKPAT